jgi:hypothetical protein
VDPHLEQTDDFRERRQHLGRRRGRGLLPQPGQACAPHARIRGEQRVKTRKPLRGQQWGEALPGHTMGLFTGRGDEAFQACEAWAHNLLATQLVTGQLEQDHRLVMFQGPLYGDCLANGQKTTLTPQSLKAHRSGARVSDGVSDVLVPQIILDQPRIVPSIRQIIPS